MCVIVIIFTYRFGFFGKNEQSHETTLWRSASSVRLSIVHTVQSKVQNFSIVHRSPYLLFPEEFRGSRPLSNDNQLRIKIGGLYLILIAPQSFNNYERPGPNNKLCTISIPFRSSSAHCHYHILGFGFRAVMLCYQEI